MRCVKENLLGKVFGRLTIIYEHEKIKGRTAWLCKCECGKEKVVKSEYLKNGDTKSCGCLNDEKRTENYKKAIASITKYTPYEAAAIEIYKDMYNDGDIAFEHFLELSQLPCHYCKEKPSNIHKSAGKNSKNSEKFKKEAIFIYNGLDRVDNSIKKHTLNNVVSCCRDCNVAKRERSQEEFKLWAKRVYEKMFGIK